LKEKKINIDLLERELNKEEKDSKKEIDLLNESL